MGWSEKSRIRHSQGGLPHLVFLFVWVAVLVAFAYHRHVTLPAPVPAAVVDALDDDASAQVPFSEERARVHVHMLSIEIGQREVGTDAELATIHYLVDQVRRIERDPARQQPMETAVEHGSGQHLFELIGAPMIKTYYNVTNLAVRLPCTECVSDKALLINTHFDSMIGAAGAADAATPVAVMLELLRAMVRDARPLRNSVVFLFNGAEETLQDASHAFMMQSPWFRDVVAVLNLEACGVSGKSILFQSKHELMLQAYARSSHPHGCAMANDLFRTGLIMSDTDYKQFMHHGELAGGLDVAIYQHSYLYHTKGDSEKNLPAGTIQHMGQNSLDALRYVAYHADLSPLVNGVKNQVTQTEYTYFDFLGYTFILMRMRTAIALAFGISLVSLAYLAATATPFALLSSLAAYSHMLLAGLLLPLAVAAALVYFDAQLLWFANEAYPVAVYAPLTLCGMLMGHRRPSGARVFGGERWARKGALLFHTLLLMVAAYAGLSSMLVPALLVVSMLLGELVPPFLGYPLAMTLPTLVLFPMIIAIVQTFVPLTGRMGGTTPAEIIVAVLVWLVTSLYVTPIAALAHRLSRASNSTIQSAPTTKSVVVESPVTTTPALRRAKLFLAALSIGTLALLAVFFSRYSPSTPKRLLLLHRYDPVTKQSALHLTKWDPAPFPPEIVEQVSQMVGTPPESAELHPEVHYNALQAVHPLNEVAHSLFWNTSATRGKFWVDESTHAIADADTYARAYAPDVRGIRVTRRADRENPHERDVMIPCAMNAHNMFTIIAFGANVTKASAPLRPGKYGRFYVRQSSGGVADVDWEGSAESHASLRTAASGCDLTFTINDPQPVTVDLAASSKYMGKRNYLIRRLLPHLPDYVDVFGVDAIHVSTTV